MVNGLRNPFACAQLAPAVYMDPIWDKLVAEVKTEDPRIVQKIVACLGNLGAVAVKPAVALAAWNCASCTFQNRSDNMMCEICNAARPAAAAQAAAASQVASKAAKESEVNWACSVCTYSNNAARSMRM